MRIIVTGAAGVVGSRVVARMLKDQMQPDVVAVDRNNLAGFPSSVIAKQVDIEIADLHPVFVGADVVVHLASGFDASSVDSNDAEKEVKLFRKVLDAAAKANVLHFVMMSSATVYGAWANNSVPMTEDAPVHPNSDFKWVVQRHELEQLASQWADGLQDDDAVHAIDEFKWNEGFQSANGQSNLSLSDTVFALDKTFSTPDHVVSMPNRTVSVLRPTSIIAEGRGAHLTCILWATKSRLMADGDPPVQYIHVDDLASAVVTVVRERYNGVINVAPDGWISPNAMASLEGFRPRLRVPTLLAKTVSVLRSQWGAPTLPGAVSYTMYPWVVANDRLKALGWEPSYSSEEAWLVANAPGRWESLSPIRRQEALLSMAGAGTLGVLACIVWGAVKLVKRRAR